MGTFNVPLGSFCSSSFTPGNECLHCCVCACELVVLSALWLHPDWGSPVWPCGVRVCPFGGSLQVVAQSWSQKLKIVAETSDHPSRCRWTAGKRASSRDARDMMEPVNLVKLLPLCQWNQRPMWFIGSTLASHLLPLRKKKALAAFGQCHFGNSVQTKVCHQFNGFASV